MSLSVPDKANTQNWHHTTGSYTVQAPVIARDNCQTHSLLQHSFVVSAPVEELRDQKLIAAGQGSAISG